MTPTLPVRVFDDRLKACRTLAGEMSARIRDINRQGRPAVLGLATGRTPLPLYEELIRLHQEEGLSFQGVITFNLDEYLGLPPGHPESYRAFMDRELFSKIDIPPGNTHIPDGNLPEDQMTSHCQQYEQAIRNAGGIDFQILGIGQTGHIGFNEPGSARDSRTRIVHLDERTRGDAASAFGGLNCVPDRAISMGCGTILDARRIALLAWGESKAGIVHTALRGEVSDQVSASFLQDHQDSTFYLDRQAASLL